ncbi:MAG: 2-amino-4-hydroxy-6-hydroxymethyldihydropteridine diphosphokinase [Verrucomicrobia bacterium]|nr:2-amino-4-hydroxy-6-hydroxymethyldihydropteridine diphosphokinase [Verrucomicrobiota bacterium]
MTSALRVGIGLGSNQGDRLDHLRSALLWIEKQSDGPVKCSGVYETDPVGCAPDTPAFLNAVCEIVSDRDPVDLLRRMREFERQRGRPATYARNAPRPLDLDLLYAGDLILQTPELILPHPRMLERRFVLQPLCDIRPDLTLPGQTRTVAQWLVSLKDDTMVRRRPEILK